MTKSREYLLGEIHADVASIKQRQAHIEQMLEKVVDSHGIRIGTLERKVWKISAVGGGIGALAIVVFKQLVWSIFNS